MRPITVSFGKGDKAAITAVKSPPWADLAKALTTEPPESDDKASRGWYIPASFDASPCAGTATGPCPLPEQGHRHGDHFISRDAITFDFDHVGMESWATVRQALDGLALCMYTTHSHNENAPRFRVVVPLSRPTSFDEFQAVSRKLASRFGIELAARESFTPPQMTYLPLRSPRGLFDSFIQNGSWADVDAILMEYQDWTNPREWPRRASGDDTHAPVEGQTPPDQKEGSVGRFCRAFRVADAISKFELPYTPAGNGRWTYTQGSVAEGAIEYDDGLKLHSHHDTDPARGQQNAFDVVRLHRFGHLDRDADRSIQVQDLPSYRAMVELVSSLPECSETKASDEFEDLGPLPAVKDADPFEEKEKPNRFPFVKPGVILAKKNPVWRIKRLYPQNGIAEVLGNSGDGKSFFIFDTFCCIARGVKWRDRAVEQCGVAYIWAEGRARERILAYETKHKIKLDDFNFHILEAAPNLFKVEDALAVIKAVQPLGVRVVAVDTLQATSNGANENSSDMSTYLANCNLIAKAIDGLVVISHHLGKNADLGSRGFSGLKGAADAEITIVREDELRQAQISKMKDGGGEGDMHPFKLEEINLGSDDDGDKITSCVVIHTDETLQKQARGRKSRPKGLPAQVLGMLRVMAPSGTCATEDLVEGVKKTLVRGDSSRDLRRQNVFTALNRLIEAQHVYKHGEDRVSLTNIKQVEEPSWLE